MTEYTALVTISRKADVVHTKIELGDDVPRIDANMVIALEFLKSVLNGAEATGVLVKPFKKGVKNILKDFVEADANEREELMNRFIASIDILGGEEQK